MGAGTQLIDAANATEVGALELWCFQANQRARRFYEARGFRSIRFTGGAQNEERMPDFRYLWKFRQRPASRKWKNAEAAVGKRIGDQYGASAPPTNETSNYRGRSLPDRNDADA
jgi:hypothetical protein